MSKLLGYIFVGVPLTASMFYWYNMVWFTRQIPWLHWYLITFAAAWIIESSMKDKTFKAVWTVIAGLVFISTIVSQILIWLGYLNYGIIN